jgi:hypothetical protein
VRQLVENSVCPKCGTDTVQRIIRRGWRQCTSCYVFYLKHSKAVVQGETIRPRRKEHTAWRPWTGTRLYVGTRRRVGRREYGAGPASVPLSTRVRSADESGRVPRSDDARWPAGIRAVRRVNSRLWPAS